MFINVHEVADLESKNTHTITRNMSTFETLKLYIPTSSHRTLIGSRGSTVKGLQSEYNVNVDIPRRESNSTLVVVKGQREGVSGAHAAINELLGYTASTEPLHKALVKVDTSDHGRLIGHRGCVLRDMEQQSQCAITIPQKQSNDDTVTIEGTPEGVQQAIAMMREIVGDVVVIGEEEVEEEDESAKMIDLVSEPIFDSLFFPDDDSSDGLSYERFLAYLGSARESLCVCVFTITDNGVAKVLSKSAERGVQVRVITDNDTASAKGSDIARLATEGIPVRTDKTEYHMHNKFAVIDNAFLLMGSYNWTRSAATKNNECMIATNQPKLCSDFSAHFEHLWSSFE